MPDQAHENDEVRKDTVDGDHHRDEVKDRASAPTEDITSHKERYDPESPVVTSLLARISEDPEAKFGLFETEEERDEWLETSDLMNEQEAYATRERIVNEVTGLDDDEFHVLAAEHLPRLLQAVSEYRLPVEDYRALLMVARASAVRGYEAQLKKIRSRIAATTPQEQMTLNYDSIRDESTFDYARCGVAEELLKEVIAAEKLGRPPLTRGKITELITNANQYLLFGPDTVNIYRRFNDRLEQSPKYQLGKDPLPDIPLEIDSDQLLFEAQKLAYRDAVAHPDIFEPGLTEKVMLPLDPYPWTLTDIHTDDKTAEIEGQDEETHEQTTRTVPLRMLIMHSEKQRHTAKILRSLGQPGVDS